MKEPTQKIKVLIRKAIVSDLSAVQLLGTELMESDNKFDPTIEKQWYFSKPGTKYILKRIRGKKGICLVAEVDKQLIGYLTGCLAEFETWRPFHRAEINNLFVRSNYQSKGIGTMLVQEFIKWSKERNAERIVLYTESKNTRAINFYQKNNFEPLLLSMEVKI